MAMTGVMYAIDRGLLGGRPGGSLVHATGSYSDSDYEPPAAVTVVVEVRGRPGHGPAAVGGLADPRRASSVQPRAPLPSRRAGPIFARFPPTP
jgi:hypothetical protein